MIVRVQSCTLECLDVRKIDRQIQNRQQQEHRKFSTLQYVTLNCTSLQILTQRDVIIPLEPHSIREDIAT